MAVKKKLDRSIKLPDPANKYAKPAATDPVAEALAAINDAQVLATASDTASEEGLEEADGGQDTGEARINTFEKYELVTVKRSEVKNAPYNPRILSDKARKKLQANIKRVGLLEPPIWNGRTGNLVGGHQRLAILDALMRTRNYTLRVAKVDLTDKEEREQNVFLNNPEAQGEWDFDRLEKLFHEDKIGHDEAGFDAADLYKMFGDSPYVDNADALVEISNQIREATERYEKMVKTIWDTREDDDFYMVVVFSGYHHRLSFIRALGLDDNRYQDGRTLISFLESTGMEVPEVTPESLAEEEADPELAAKRQAEREEAARKHERFLAALQGEGEPDPEDIGEGDGDPIGHDSPLHFHADLPADKLREPAGDDSTEKPGKRSKKAAKASAAGDDSQADPKPRRSRAAKPGAEAAE